MNKKTYSAEEVRNARRLLGFSQVEFAAEIGVTNQHLSAVERGLYGISERMARNIDRILAAHELPNVIRGSDEARIIHIYRLLSPASRAAIAEAAESLFAATGSATEATP
jgi:transcriptional regulator with XRE-family HTH domain